MLTTSQSDRRCVYNIICKNNIERDRGHTNSIIPADVSINVHNGRVATGCDKNLINFLWLI